MSFEDDELPPYQPERDEKGRFKPGSSGNPRGSAYRIGRDPNLPAARRRVISKVADEEVDVKVNGVTTRMTMFEASVRSLGIAGAKDRVAAKHFIEMVTSNSKEQLLHSLIGHQTVEAMLGLEEENDRLRAKLGPGSGVLQVPVVGPLEEWSVEAALDDDERVAVMMRSQLDESETKGPKEAKDDEPRPE